MSRMRLVEDSSFCFRTVEIVGLVTIAPPRLAVVRVDFSDLSVLSRCCLVASLLSVVACLRSVATLVSDEMARR